MNIYKKRSKYIEFAVQCLFVNIDLVLLTFVTFWTFFQYFGLSS